MADTSNETVVRTSPKIRVEWIGVKSMKSDDRIRYRRITKRYTPEQERAMDTVERHIWKSIRIDGKSGRALTPRDGFDHWYQWGPKGGTYVQEMTERDAMFLLNEHPDRLEFRNLDDPAHDDRQPQIPWPWITRLLMDILKEAANGPGVFVVGEKRYMTTREFISDIVSGT